MCLLTDDKNDNPIIIRPHMVFTDERQQRQSNHNTTTYCGHMKHDVKKHSYNYQFHVMLSLFLHVSQSESYLGDNCIVFENFTASIGDLMVAN